MLIHTEDIFITAATRVLEYVDACDALLSSKRFVFDSLPERLLNVVK